MSVQTYGWSLHGDSPAGDASVDDEAASDAQTAGMLCS